MAGPSFEATIKPYFTEVDRNQMMDSSHTGGFTLDLWLATDCQKNWSIINRVVARGQMPPAGSPPNSDGPWDAAKISQFATDFLAWKNGGYLP